MSGIAAISPVFSLVGGPLVWAAHFFMVYASESLSCTRGAPAWVHALVVTVATVAAVLLLLILIARCTAVVARPASPEARFTLRAARALAGLGLIAIGWAALAAVALPACLAPGQEALAPRYPRALASVAWPGA